MPEPERTPDTRPDIATWTGNCEGLQEALMKLKEDEYQVNNIMTHQGMAAADKDGHQMFTLIALLPPFARLSPAEREEFIRKQQEAQRAAQTGQTPAGLALPVGLKLHPQPED